MHRKQREKTSGNYTSNPMAGDDIPTLGSSTDDTTPPRDDLHPKIEKQRTTSMLFHI
jgi:hypothetical protein